MILTTLRCAVTGCPFTHTTMQDTVHGQPLAQWWAARHELCPRHLAERDQRERGEALKEHGQAQALQAEDEAWKADAQAAIDRLALLSQPFTAEDVAAEVGRRPSRPNAMGAAMSAAAKRGAIRAYGIAKAARTDAHARVLRTWIGT